MSPSPRPIGTTRPVLPDSFREAVRSTFSGRIIYAGRYTAERAAKLVDAGLADLIAFGRPFIANPDLPQRLFNGWPLNPLREEGMYGGGGSGLYRLPHVPRINTRPPQGNSIWFEIFTRPGLRPSTSNP